MASAELDKFIGTWKEQSTTNKAAYQEKRFGDAPGPIKDKMKKHMSQPMTFSMAREGEQYRMRVMSGTEEITTALVTPGVEHDIPTPMGPKIKSVMKYENGAMRTEQKDPRGKIVKISHELTDAGTVKITSTYEGVSMEIIAKKQ